MPSLDELKFQEKSLTEKIARLKSGAITAQAHEGDGRNEMAIHRAEVKLRDVKKQIVDTQKEAK